MADAQWLLDMGSVQDRLILGTNRAASRYGEIRAFSTEASLPPGAVDLTGINMTMDPRVNQPRELIMMRPPSISIVDGSQPAVGTIAILDFGAIHGATQFIYSWMSDGVPIDGTSQQQDYIITADQEGAVITVHMTARLSNGHAQDEIVVDTNSLGPIAAAP